MEKQEILTERSVVVEVLTRYRQLSYLWNSTHKLYTNKIARRQGMEILLQSWRKLEPHADLECMKKKLSNWRAAYRRERNKLLDSVRIATEPDEIHKPNLWYYNYLTFIHDDCPVLGKDDDDVVVPEEPVKFVEAAGGDEESDDGGNEEGVADDSVSDDEIEEEQQKKIRKAKKRKFHDRSAKRETLVEPAPAQVTVHSNDESSADLFGRAIGSQLKDVSKFQRCLAEKLISEIIFYAKLEQLTIGTSINLEHPDSLPT